MEPTALLRLEPPFLCADHAREHRGVVAIVLLELYRVQLLEVGSRQKAVGNVSCQVIVATLNSFGFIVRRGCNWSQGILIAYSPCLLLGSLSSLWLDLGHWASPLPTAPCLLPTISIPSPPIPCQSLLGMTGCNTAGPSRLTLTLTFK